VRGVRGEPVTRLPDEVRDWPREARFEYEERAGMIEHLGRNPSKREAERRAEALVRDRHAQGLIPEAT
jgi:hypothetical protein